MPVKVSGAFFCDAWAKIIQAPYFEYLDIEHFGNILTDGPKVEFYNLNRE